jgi:hypothetical protein
LEHPLPLSQAAHTLLIAAPVQIAGLCAQKIQEQHTLTQLQHLKISLVLRAVAKMESPLCSSAMYKTSMVVGLEVAIQPPK